MTLSAIQSGVNLDSKIRTPSSAEGDIANATVLSTKTFGLWTNGLLCPTLHIHGPGDTRTEADRSRLPDTLRISLSAPLIANALDFRNNK